jgi:putative peptide zinc metalloprotease protein
MVSTSSIPTSRRPELIIQPSGGGGSVVKDPISRTYYRLGEQEAFLLTRLDGRQSVDDIRREFEETFDEPLSEGDVNDFVDLAREQSFLADGAKVGSTDKSLGRQVRQIFYWRRSLIDPDRFLNWLEPRTRFLFTGVFLAGSLGLICWASLLFFTHREEFIRYIPRSWEALVFVWVTVALATWLHELAHGLACKHYGGEVHEIGVLLMFFMPCFYCDVSDAWLFREKSKRLWVTVAGTYCDLCVWALGVLIWRLTLPDTLAGAFAAVVVSVCGIRCFFNAIPLLKLDGYYFLSDLLELHNLRQRSLARVADYVRWLLWGGARPEAVPRSRLLLALGVATWSFSVFFLVMMLYSLGRYLLFRWGILGFAGVAFLGWLSIPNLFADFSKGEIMNMFRFRWRRLAIWGSIAAAAAVALAVIPMHEKATGPFRVRPSSRAEIRAPVSGFLHTIYREEGQDVEPGALIVLLEVPDLSSKISEKEAEVNEARAKWRLAELGPRKEEIAEQRHKAARAKEWRDLAEQDLARKRKALAEEITRLGEAIRQHTAERDNARDNLAVSQRLFERKALALDQLRDWEKRHIVAEAQVKQAEAAHRERVTVGLQEPEGELAKRDKEWADARSALTLLEIGTRPEEVDAQKAHLQRLEESLSYLRKISDKVKVQSSIAGVITTPYLKEKIGSYVKEGDLICEVENTRNLEVEIPLLEQEVGYVEVGCDVELKARALPFETLKAKVHRIAPAAAKPEKPELAPATQNTLTVYCRLDDSTVKLHPGMTGYARI